MFDEFEQEETPTKGMVSLMTSTTLIRMTRSNNASTVPFAARLLPPTALIPKPRTAVATFRLYFVSLYHLS